MAKTFSIDVLRSIMDRKDNIRNLTVIAHVDHGKSTLTDALIRKAGISTRDRFTASTEEEQARGISIFASGVSLYFELPPEVALPPDSKGENGFLLNLIDSPGHVDFSSEVTAALRVTDGAIVVVDFVEGVGVQTETVLRQALAERIRPVLVINKLDRAINELRLEPEDAYRQLERIIETVNSILATYSTADPTLQDVSVDPLKGTVAFASARDGWGFTIPTLARMLARQNPGTTPKRYEKVLWGEHFYSSDLKKFVSSSGTSANGKPHVRGFCKFALAPIWKLVKAIMQDRIDDVLSFIKPMNIKLSREERELRGRKLMTAVMPRFMPLGDVLLEMAVLHLPSPVVAQKIRTELLYEGPQDDEIATAMRNCDPNGPLMMYISKLVPDEQETGFYAFGRVFSGTIRTGQRVNILGTNYSLPDNKSEKPRDFYENKSVQKTCLSMARYFEPIPEIPSGNIGCLGGIEQYVLKTATITTNPSKRPFPIRGMKFAVSPVVRVAVKAAKATELTKLINGLRKLVHVDPCVQVQLDKETGENIIAGAGELHIEILIKQLQSLTGGIEIVTSPPQVSYRETITQPSSTCLAKSANKLNRLYMTAEPLPPGLPEAIEGKEIGPMTDPVSRSRILAEKYHWDKEEAKRIVAFGPNDDGPNVLVEATRGVQYVKESLDSISTAFAEATRKGVLCGEPMRGVRFNLVDAMLHSDAVHRGPGQLVPAAQRAMFACVLTGKPRLLEPIYLLEIQTEESVLGSIYNLLSQRRGSVFYSEPRTGTPLYTLKAYLPVSESIGFTAELRNVTKGKAFPQATFDHWELLDSDPLEEGSKAHQLVLEIRERKGLHKGIPPLANFLDKL